MSEPLSPKNPEVARVRALARNRRDRREAGRFVVEGPKLVLEALGSGLVVPAVFVAESHALDPALVSAVEAAGSGLVRVADRGFERMASTSSPQPVLCEVELPDRAAADLVGARRVLVAADINDPGNLGTLVRSAEAAGFDAVVASGNTADPFGPKAIRASAGAAFRLAIIEAEPQPLIELLAEFGLDLVGTRMADATPCDEADLTGPMALVLGSEAHGLEGPLAHAVKNWVSIPMAGHVESLNVAMAGTILTYEVARQDRSRARI